MGAERVPEQRRVPDDGGGACSLDVRDDGVEASAGSDRPRSRGGSDDELGTPPTRSSGRAFGSDAASRINSSLGVAAAGDRSRRSDDATTPVGVDDSRFFSEDRRGVRLSRVRKLRELGLLRKASGVDPPGLDYCGDSSF